MKGSSSSFVKSNGEVALTGEEHAERRVVRIIIIDINDNVKLRMIEIK